MADPGQESSKGDVSQPTAYLFTADRRAAARGGSHPWVIVVLDLNAPRVILRLKRPDGSPVRVSLDAAVVGDPHADALQQECAALRPNAQLTESGTPHLHALLTGIHARFFERGSAIFRGSQRFNGRSAELDALADAQFAQRADAMIAREWDEI